MNEDDRIVILTGVSCSWKSTLQKELAKRGWNSPLNFTTRKPRDDTELDEYVFLTENQYMTKFANWDFLENTKSYWTHYAISKDIKEWNNVIVLDSAGREQVVKELVNRGYEVETYFLTIDKTLQAKRFEERGDDEEEISKRSNDFLIYRPSSTCVLLDWAVDTTVLADMIEWV